MAATTNSRSSGELVRVLGIIFGLAAVVGGMVGQGILRSPGLVAAAVPDARLMLLLWVLGGMFAALAAIPYAEAAASFPCAGGPYAFARRGLGPAAGVTVGWSDWFNNLSALAFLSVVLAEFTQRLGFLTAVPVFVLAPLSLSIFFAINLTGTKMCGASQVLGSALKGLGIVLVIVALFAGKAASATAPAMSDHSGAVIGLAGLVVAFRAVQGTYNGWNSCTYFCEEIHGPERQVPRAMFGGIALVAILYLLVNIAILRVLSPGQMAGSKLAAGDALRAAVGGWADQLLNIFALVSIAAITNLIMMYCSRIAFAMARNRVLPSALSTVRPNGTPRSGLITTAAISALLAASGSYEQLLAISVAAGMLADSLVTVSVINLRRTEPNLRRPWRAPFYPWSVGLAALLQFSLLAAMIWEDPLHSLIGTGTAAVMGAAYAWRHRRVQQVALPT